MAKKKTAIPDNSTDKPAASRRRSPRTASTTATPSTPDVIEAAADMSAPLPSLNDEYSPSYEEIAEAAYQRYLSRGGEHGQDWDDWLAAERDLRTKR